MAKPASDIPPQESVAVRHYEQPLSERMRTFLRLEFLYQQMLYNSEREADWATRATIGTLLDVMAILSRGDVRSDVHKELDHQLGVLQAVVQDRRPLLLEDLPNSSFLPASQRKGIQAKSALLVPLILDNEVAGGLSAGKEQSGAIGKEDVDLLLRLASQASVALVNARLHESIQALSLTDPLTDLPNRRHMDIHLQREVAAARKLEGWRIPADLDYKRISGLSTEATQKLHSLRPHTLGQAGRIDGVRAADVALLLVHLERGRRQAGLGKMPVRQASIEASS